MAGGRLAVPSPQLCNVKFYVGKSFHVDILKTRIRVPTTKQVFVVNAFRVWAPDSLCGSRKRGRARGPHGGSALGTFLNPWSYLRAPSDNKAAGNVTDDLAAWAGRRSSNVGLCGATANVAGVLTVSPHQDGLAGRVVLSGIEQLGASARLGHFTNRNGVRTVNRGREMSNRAG